MCDSKQLSVILHSLLTQCAIHIIARVMSSCLVHRKRHICVRRVGGLHVEDTNYNGFKSSRHLLVLLVKVSTKASECSTYELASSFVSSLFPFVSSFLLPSYLSFYSSYSFVDSFHSSILSFLALSPSFLAFRDAFLFRPSLPPSLPPYALDSVTMTVHLNLAGSESALKMTGSFKCLNSKVKTPSNIV